MCRFSKDASGSCSKYTTINNVHYKLTIQNEVWNSICHRKIQNHINYWKQDPSRTLRYGSYEIVSMIPTHSLHICDICSKSYKSRAGYLCHIKKHHPPPEPKEEPDTAEPVNERTVIPVTNIEHQTNNIQVNLPPLRNFTEENHKWLTHDVIMEAIRDIPTAIPYLIKEKHFNDRFPENQNVRLDNKRSLKKRLKVYDDGMWRLKERPDVEFRLIKQMYDVLFDFVEMMTDEEEDELDDEATPIDRRIANITRRIRTSELRSDRVRQSLRGWDEFKDSIEDEYEKTIEPFKDKLDTYLLDMDLRLEQLRERRAMLMDK